jgi:hypothetical protein
MPSTMVGNAKESLCLTRYYAMKTYGGVGIQIHVFLTSALIQGEWSASRPGPHYPQGKNPLDRKLGGPQSLSGRYQAVKILDPTGIRTPTPRPSSP